MKYLIIPFLAIMGYFGVTYGIIVASYVMPIKIASELTYVGQDNQPALQTKMFPDVQLQPALAVQGTVGVE